LELDDPPLLKLEDPPLLELDDPPLLKLDDPPLLELDDPPLLELDELRPLELDESLLELAELLLLEPDEFSLVDTELSCARATCANEARPGLAESAVAPATSSTATGRAIKRAGENFIRSFVRNLTVEPFPGVCQDGLSVLVNQSIKQHVLSISESRPGIVGVARGPSLSYSSRRTTTAQRAAPASMVELTTFFCLSGECG
ncbi:MAG: hypothetical protein M3Z66_21290, partial [Chloroflexota bacterium]|nr:hypothetical protein [Chloroflexota bacterium]